MKKEEIDTSGGKSDIFFDTSNEKADNCDNTNGSQFQETTELSDINGTKTDNLKVKGDICDINNSNNDTLKVKDDIFDTKSNTSTMAKSRRW